MYNKNNIYIYYKTLIYIKHRCYPQLDFKSYVIQYQQINNTKKESKLNLNHH